jgi:hypothetical protein
MVGLSLVAVLVVGVHAFSPTSAESASGAGLTCGSIALSQPDKNFIHGCSGQGTVQYTLACYTSNTVRSYGWSTGGQNRVFSAVCSNGATAWKVTYKIIK